MLRILFLCGRGLRRSPTAERLFARRGEIETASAGVSRDAESPVCAELVEWADVICVMEPSHRSKLNRAFGRQLRGKRVVCLDIADDHEFMDAGLQDLLRARMTGIVRTAPDVNKGSQGV